MKVFKMLLICMVCLSSLAALSCLSKEPKSGEKKPKGGSVSYAGIRSSIYGIPDYTKPGTTKPAWPSPADLALSMTHMAGYFPGSVPATIWIVGHLDEEGCGLEFEKPEGYKENDPNIRFAPDALHVGSEERTHASHDAYLDYFDTAGIKVFLQVESGRADPEKLIDLVLKRFGKHPSVIGFGFDVEWYSPDTTVAVDADAGLPVGDKLAREWEKRVKSHNPAYQLLLKHYDSSFMCPDGYRGDIVFCDDTQYFYDSYTYITEMQRFAEHFYPNTVLYQIGYELDKPWWTILDKPAVEDYGLEASVPPQAIGQKLLEGTKQKCGIIWVDFTMDQVLPPYVKPRF